MKLNQEDLWNCNHMDTKNKLLLIKKVKENLGAIREVLDRPVSPDDLTGVQEKLIDLIEISGLAGYTEGIAKSCYESELSEALELLLQDPDNAKKGSNNIMAIAKGKVSTYLGAVSYSERLGRNISHAMDGLRTIISLQKEELSQRKWNETT